MVLKNFSLT